MALEGEPRNGDYAAYIDRLVNSGSRAPGQVLKELESVAAQASRGAPRHSRWEDDPDTNPWPTLPPASPTPESWRHGERPVVVARQAPVPGATERQPRQDPPADGTLASRNRAQRRSLGLWLAGGVLGLFGLNMIVAGLAEEGDSILPGVFLLAFAWVLIRAGGKRQARLKGPLKPLPPLSTVSRRDTPPR